jgi:hypothetical protein
MPNWKTEIDQEMGRAREAERRGNAGRVRTCARRIAGIALRQVQQQFPQLQLSSDYLTALYAVKKSNSIPPHVAEAAARLQARISENFISPSSDPIGDAIIIVKFVEQKLSTS